MKRLLLSIALSFWVLSGSAQILQGLDSIVDMQFGELDIEEGSESSSVGDHKKHKHKKQEVEEEV